MQRRNPTRGNVVFVISNENDEAGGGISHACTDKNSNPGDEVVSLLSQSLSGFSQSSFNVGNLLDKLKAVLLHVLLMEQWNDSRIKLSHRKYWLNAANLIHYLAVQDLEVDQLKADLSSIGILSLEAIYSDVFAGLFAGTQILENLKSNSINSQEGVLEGISTQKSFEKLKTGEFKIFSIKKDVSLRKELLLRPLQGKKSTHHGNSWPGSA
ncbi:hypothetical protein RHGRI_008667 [Rhododendron griersonianum]|uniref:Uncharacterized protein n=1 Tax=Rhododendron griersonianum TaxID=479676 RepID=A0AAV6L1C7_9ERIC|nr:hypothetical protein RHGRI_008667 [Rhododendron griersonianum]